MANFSYFYLEPNAADVYLAGAGARFLIDRRTEHMQIIAKFEGCHSGRSQTFMLSTLGGKGSPSNAGFAGPLSVLQFECDVATNKNNLYENIFFLII